MSASSKAKGLQIHERSSTHISRLRKACDEVLVTSQPLPAGDAARPSVIPQILRRCDGADIIKKNAARRKKYLFAFPGGVALAPGTRLGMLHGLDSSTPTLDIQYPEGRLRMYGVLVFPRNPMLTLKCSASKGRPVQCADTFETIILFSRWAWIGDEVSNPGDLPQPLPVSLRGNVGHPVWRSARKSSAPMTPRAADDDAGGIPPQRNVITIEDEEKEEEEEVISASSPEDLAEDDKFDDDDESAQWNPIKNLGRSHDRSAHDADGIAPVPVRSNPIRARRPDFKKIFAESSDDDNEEDDSAEGEDDDLHTAGDEDDIVIVDEVNESSGDQRGVHKALLMDAVPEESVILNGSGHRQKILLKTSSGHLNEITKRRRLRPRVGPAGGVSLHRKNDEVGSPHVQGGIDQNEDDDDNDDSDVDVDLDDDSGDGDFLL
jgi:hypothetical protein